MNVYEKLSLDVWKKWMVMEQMVNCEESIPRETYKKLHTKYEELFAVCEYLQRNMETIKQHSQSSDKEIVKLRCKLEKLKKRKQDDE